MKRRIAVAITAALLVQDATANDQSSSATIYRCKTADGVTFADRPCGATSQRYEPDLSSISVVETVTPAPRSVKTGAAAPLRHSQPNPPAVTPKADVCQQLQQSLSRIASTMRSGYSAKQGERLRERKRELENKRRAQRC